MKLYIPLLIILFVLMLTGCQRVGDARTEFCESLDDVGALATDFKSARVEEPVDEFRAKVETFRIRRRHWIGWQNWFLARLLANSHQSLMR